MRWDDVENGDMSEMPFTDMMPFNYYDWYLPRIEAGEDMPADFSD